MQPRPPVYLERLRRKVLSPLFDRLGYDLVPAAPDWSHRPTSPREVATLLDTAAAILERDLAAAGIVSPRPLATMAETISVCRALLAGETMDFKGEVFHVAGRRLASGARNVPIVLAASRPHMLRLAGRESDGVLISAATSALASACTRACRSEPQMPARDTRRRI